MKLLILSALLYASVPCARAVVISETFSGIDTAIPDGDLSGLVNNQTISGAFGTITDVNVTLSISGTGFGAVNGDLYAYLSHDSGFAVLLNRSGRTAGSTLGYDDNGYDGVVFDDSAANGDVHAYRFTLLGNNDQALSPFPSPLTGTWAPDGRNVSPTVVSDLNERSAPLSAFNGLDPNGLWTLFISDVAAGGTARLDGWGLQITVVPEPAHVALATGISLAVIAGFRRWRTRTALSAATISKAS